MRASASTCKPLAPTRRSAGPAIRKSDPEFRIVGEGELSDQAVRAIARLLLSLTTSEEECRNHTGP